MIPSAEQTTLQQLQCDKTAIFGSNDYRIQNNMYLWTRGHNRSWLVTDSWGFRSANSLVIPGLG